MVQFVDWWKIVTTFYLQSIQVIRYSLAMIRKIVGGNRLFTIDAFQQTCQFWWCFRVRVRVRHSFNHMSADGECAQYALGILLLLIHHTVLLHNM